MKRYEKYKKVDLHWIEEVPEHWGLHKIKHVFKERSEKGYPNEKLLAATQNHGVIPKDLYENRTVLAMKGLETLKLVRIGDFVISLRSFEGGIEYAYYQGIISPAYTVIYSNQMLEDRYFKYLGKSFPFIQLLQLCVTGILEGQNINYGLLKNKKIPIPSKSEQKKIAAFLDYKISRIDKTIKFENEKKEFINKLKQSIISDAVTKGLNPNVSMKDSKVDWIGNIPRSWEIVKIKRLFQIQKRIAGKEGYKVFSITQKGLKVKDISRNEGQMAADYSNYQLVYPGDFAMNHMDLLTGFVDCAKEFGVTSPDYRVFECISEKCLKQYYLYIFQLCYKNHIFYRHGRGAATLGRWRMPSIEFLNFEIPLPALDEQKKIVKYLDEKTSQIDDCLTKIDEKIDKLESLKQSLISEVVIGQIDVRDFEIPEEG